MIDFSEFNNSIRSKKLKTSNELYKFTLGGINSFDSLNNFQVSSQQGKIQRKIERKEVQQNKNNLSYDSQRQRYSLGLTYKLPEQYQILLQTMRKFEKQINLDGQLTINPRKERGLTIQLFQLLSLDQTIYDVFQGSQDEIIIQIPMSKFEEEDTTTIETPNEESRLQKIKTCLEDETVKYYNCFLEVHKIKENHNRTLYKIFHPEFDINHCPVIQARKPSWSDVSTDDLCIVLREIFKIFSERYVNFMLESVLVSHLLQRIVKVTENLLEECIKDLLILLPQVIKFDWTRFLIVNNKSEKVLQLNTNLKLDEVLYDLRTILV